MPAVLVPFVAVGVALLVLLFAYALTVILTPILTGLAREVPVVGHWIGAGIQRASDYAARQISSWANKGVGLLTGWLHGLARVWSEFVDATNAYLVDLPDHLRHLVTHTIPALIRLETDPLGAALGLLKSRVDDLPDGIDQVFAKPLHDFKGIEHGVELRVDHLANVLRNVDLPDLFSTVEADVQAARGYAAGLAGDLGAAVDDEFGRVWDQLSAIPLRKLLDLLAASVGTFALVDVIAREAGLERAECRDKVKQICSTDPAAWAALLDVAGLALAWVGIGEFVQLAQELAREALPIFGEVLGGR